MKTNRLHLIIRAMFMLAAVWAVIAGIFIFFTFGSTQVTEIAIEAESSQQTVQQTVEQLSWFESQGWWGIAILFIFAALFYGPLHFYNRKRIGWTVIFGIVAIVMSILSGFSIGTMYWLGSLALLLGLMLLPFVREK